jgi:hypothetical protein
VWLDEPGDTFGIYIAKLFADGTPFSFATVLSYSKAGYSGVANSVAVDPFGNFFVAGDFTNPHFPIGDNVPSPAKPNYANLVKFSASGTLLWAAQLPVTPSKVLADAEGDLYMAGNANVTQSVPVTAGAYQTTIDPNCANNSGGLFTRPQIERPRHMTDVYLAKLDPEAKSVFFATLFGGACRDTVTDFAVGSDGSLHVAGSTYSDPLPSLGLLFPAPPAERSKPFVARLDATGSHLLLSTYLDYGQGARAFRTTPSLRRAPVRRGRTRVHRPCCFGSCLSLRPPCSCGA